MCSAPLQRKDRKTPNSFRRFRIEEIATLRGPGVRVIATIFANAPRARPMPWPRVEFPLVERIRGDSPLDRAPVRFSPEKRAAAMEEAAKYLWIAKDRVGDIARNAARASMRPSSPRHPGKIGVVQFHSS